MSIGGVRVRLYWVTSMHRGRSSDASLDSTANNRVPVVSHNRATVRRGEGFSSMQQPEEFGLRPPSNWREVRAARMQEHSQHFDSRATKPRGSARAIASRSGTLMKNAVLSTKDSGGNVQMNILLDEKNCFIRQRYFCEIIFF